MFGWFTTKKKIEDRYEQKIRYLKSKIFDLEEENRKLIKKNNTLEIMPEVRGKRYDEIIYPENLEEYKDWLFGGVKTSLSTKGKIKGNEFFLNAKD